MVKLNFIKVVKTQIFIGLKQIQWVFNIIPEDLDLPKIKKILISSILRYEVTINIEVSEICDLYYVLALKGTDDPEVD